MLSEIDRLRSARVDPRAHFAVPVALPAWTEQPEKGLPETSTDMVSLLDLFLEKQRGFLYGRFSSFPTVWWQDSLGHLNHLTVYVRSRVQQGEGDASMCIRFSVNNPPFDVERSVYDGLECKSHYLPKASGDHPNTSLEITSSSEESGVFAGWIPAWLAARVGKGKIPDPPFPFVEFTPNEISQRHFYSAAGWETYERIKAISAR